ncbi:MAG: hypothetical protein O2960_23560 [Verrucomicrobia bacterium]|nr:hypothetical protein [Verrucomicrobiota bacterium]
MINKASAARTKTTELAIEMDSKDAIPEITKWRKEPENGEIIMLRIKGPFDQGNDVKALFNSTTG